MTSGTAPARRVGFFAGEGATGDATPAGLDLLENTIVWATDLDLTVATEPLGGAAPDALTLDPAHPNPSASSTTLAYEVPRAGRVSLAVSDALGRRVERLADGRHAAGRYRVTWQPSGLAAGVYLVVLRTDAATRTQRVVLTR